MSVRNSYPHRSRTSYVRNIDGCVVYTECVQTVCTQNVHVTSIRLFSAVHAAIQSAFVRTMDIL